MAGHRAEAQHFLPTTSGSGQSEEVARARAQRAQELLEAEESDDLMTRTQRAVRDAVRLSARAEGKLARLKKLAAALLEAVQWHDDEIAECDRLLIKTTERFTEEAAEPGSSEPTAPLAQAEPQALDLT